MRMCASEGVFSRLCDAVFFHGWIGRSLLVFFSFFLPDALLLHVHLHPFSPPHDPLALLATPCPHAASRPAHFHLQIALIAGGASLAFITLCGGLIYMYVRNRKIYREYRWVLRVGLGLLRWLWSWW